MLACANLSLGYPGKALCLDLKWGMRPGECWALLGQNGSGKTTLLHTLGGLRTPLAGVVTLDGKALYDYPRRDLARRVGVLLQHEDYGFWGSVTDYVLLGRHPHRRSPFGWSEEDRHIAEEALAQVDMSWLAGRPLDTLSGGERQRARLALLLTQQTGICLLDEPLQYLDVRHQVQTLELLRGLTDAGKAVMLSLHDVSWAARYCSHALLLHDDGTAESGKSEEVLTRARLEHLYRCAFEEVGGGVLLPRPADWRGSV
ncbi:MAG: ABC transporter ATP-binding protein [Pseudomonadota bacterium]